MTTPCPCCGWNGDPEATTRETGPSHWTYDHVAAIREWFEREGFGQHDTTWIHQGASDVACGCLEVFDEDWRRYVSVVVYNTGAERVSLNERKDGQTVRTMLGHERVTPKLMNHVVLPFLRGEDVQWRGQ